MSKRKETLEIESTLHYMCRKRRIYGCEEVTIGFYNNGHGNEVVDFCTMDSKGLLRCYEIKVTLADLKSKAKKSWYGHYNYLFVTRKLYGKIQNNLSDYIPDYVGVAIPCPQSWSDGVEIRRNAKKQALSAEDEQMMKESMIRSMHYKIQKYRDAADMEKVSALHSQLRKAERERDESKKETHTLCLLLSRIERILRLYYGKEDVDLTLINTMVENHKLLLPEKISLFLTERGKKYNEKVKKREE